MDDNKNADSGLTRNDLIAIALIGSFVFGIVWLVLHYFVA